MKNKFANALSLALIVAMLFTSVALADNVQNDVVAGGNDTITTGGSTTVSYRIAANNGDGQTGCNAADATPATVTINTPTGVTVDTSGLPGNQATLTFTSCGTDQSAIFSSNTGGNYLITVSVSDSGAGTYNTNPANFTLHVNAPVIQNQSITVTNAAPASAVYGSSFNVSATATSGLPVAITTAGSCTGSGSGSATVTMTSGLGNCSVYYNQAGNPSYNPAPQVFSTTGAQKASVTVTADAKSKAYGDSDPVLTYQVTSGSLVSGDGFSGALSRAAGETVGAYAINQDTLALDANKYNLTYSGADLTIGARSITVNADAKSKTYGDVDPDLTYKITNGSLVAGDSFTGSLTRAAGESVGSYAITQNTLALNSNYALNFVGANFAITARPITVTADAQSKVYGQTDPALTYKITDGSLIGTDALSGALARDAGEDVGSYAIQQGSLALNNNYALTFVDSNLTISARPITVTADAQAKVYGNADPALTYKVTSGSLVNSDAFSGALTRDAGEDVGSYAIQQGTLTAGNNYSISFVGADLTITARSITVTADTQTKVYGDADPALTYKVTSGSLAYTDAFSGALTRDAGEDVGSHAITQGTLALSNNYNLTYVGADLTISQRPVEVTADAKNKTYGDADPALTYKITSGSLAYTDAFSGALTRDAGEDVGSHAITQGTLALSSNYNLSFIGANLTINKRSVTVTADAKSKTYGDADPALTYQITSGSLAFTDAFSGALTRVAGEDAAQYDIQQGTLALSNNYDLSFIGAKLTINKAALAVKADNKSIYFGQSDPDFTFTYSGFKLSEDASVLNTLPICGVIGTHTAVNTYAIVCSGGDDNNYSFSYVDGTLTVQPWSFGGFYQPVDMNGVVNTVKNGSTVPLKFEIFAGDTELKLTSYVKGLTYTAVSCSTAPADEIELTVTGQTSLRYDTTSGQFVFNWKTPSTANACYRVTMTTQDGSSLVAYFRLK